MRILRLDVQDFKRVVVAAISPDQSVIQVTGANASGKSTILDAIMCALAGARGHPAEPIRTGQHKATIVCALGEGEVGEFTVTRKFTAAGSTLEIAQPNGAVFKKPQQVLDGLLGALSFDPLAFARLPAKEQADQLRRIVKLDVDVDALDGQVARAYTERTEVNREVKRLTERVASLGAGLDLEADTTPVLIRPFLDQLSSASEHNAAIITEQARRGDLAKWIDAFEQEVTELEEQITRLRERQSEVRAALTACLREVHDLAPLPTPIDVALLRAAVDDATRENAARAQLERNRVDHRKAIDELTARSQEAELLTDTIDAAEVTKRAAIERANMPVPGLSFGADGITYQGIPLAQASSAEQLRVSVAIGMALNPKLRVLCVKEGSLLDETSLGLLEAMAEEHDFQVWVERVDVSGAVGITMVDGMVAAVNGEPVAEPDALVADGALVEA